MLRSTGTDIHWHFLGKGIFRDISSDDVLPEVASALS